MVEHAGSDVLFRRAQGGHRPFEMILDDVLRSAECCECRQPEHVRMSLALDLPQPLQHELQIRRLDAGPVLLDGGAASDEPRVDPACRNLPEDRFDERGLDLDGGRLELVVAPEWAEHGRAGGGAIEQVEAKVVREEAWNPSLEDIQSRELIVADAEHDVDAEARTGHELGQEVEQSPFGVVEEELLELVEDEHEVAAKGCCPGVEAVGEVAWRVPGVAAERVGQSAADRVLDRRYGVARPGAEVCDGQRLGLGERPQRSDDPGAEQRRLADPARAVQHRQPGCERVGGDDLRFAPTPEEEERVELGVVEGGQALVRGAKRFCDDRHPAAPSVACACISETNSSRGRELGSTPRFFQNSRSIAPADG